MKRILTIAASFAAVLGLASCECQMPERPLSEGEYFKKISLSFDNERTRSTSSASEFNIDEATVFVYQTNGTTGVETLYEKVTTESTSLDVQLLFSNNTEFSYRFDAYANMNQLTDVPTEVLFSNEENDNLQMHGTLNGINASNASSATISMERYIGRVVVSSVKLNWKNYVNATQPFILKRIWLANTAEVYGGAAVYNIGGTQTDSNMDMFLVSEVNQVIENKATYNTSHYLYGYAAEGSSLVLECEWAGETYYYHCDTILEANSTVNYKLSIHQTGASQPLGEITDDALVAVGQLVASDWNESESNTTFGEGPSFEGVAILSVDNVLYTAEQWVDSGLPNDQAVGVAVGNGKHSFLVHPTESAINGSERPDFANFDSELDEDKWVIDGISAIHYTDKESAQVDYSGISNTNAILTALETNANGIESAPAATYCYNHTFKNGNKGYLPAIGELWMCCEREEDINTCLEAIGGTIFTCNEYTSSTADSTPELNSCYEIWIAVFNGNQSYITSAISDDLMGPTRPFAEFDFSICRYY